MKDRIEDILDRCIETARSGGDPEAILRDHPDLADDVRPLLAVATDVEALPAPAANRRHMMKVVAKAVSQPDGKATSPRKARFSLFRHPALARAAAILIVVLLIGWGTVRASSSAIPGDFLYPIKLLTERVRYSLTVNPQGQAELLITFSDERLQEALKKHQEGGGVDAQLLGQMLDYAKQALEKGFDMNDFDRDRLIQNVTGLHHIQKRCLEQLQANAGAQDRPVISAFLEVCSSRCDCLKHMGGYCECCVPSKSSAEALREWVQKFPAPPQLDTLPDIDQ